MIRSKDYLQLTSDSISSNLGEYTINKKNNILLLFEPKSYRTSRQRAYYIPSITSNQVSEGNCLESGTL